MVMGRDGPLPALVRREEYMVAQVQESIDGKNRGLFIVGQAHLHSMSEKLLDAGYEVEAFNWTAPPIRL